MLVLAVTALPLAAGIDDDWKSYFTAAQQSAARKDFAHADLLYRRALKTAELFGDTDPRVGTTLEGFGTTLRGEKKLQEAETTLRRAMEILATDPGEDSAEYARCHFDLAGVLMDEGKYNPALESLKRALGTFMEKLGPHDVNTATAYCMQGDSYRMLKNYSSAEPALKRCAEMRSDDGGIGTPEFGEAANSLALVYQNLGKYSAADTYFNLAAKVREITLGILSPELADTLEAHSTLLHQLGRDDEAKRKARLAATIRAHVKNK